MTLSPIGVFKADRIISAKQIGDGIPVPDASGAVARLMSELSASDFPESEATLRADGVIVLN